MIPLPRAFDTDPTLAANSDGRAPSQKAIKSYVDSAGGTYQPLDSDLTTIAGLTATTDSFMQAKSSAWAARTIAQVKTDLGLTGTNSGDQTITLTGDVTGSGTGSFAATIASAAVTLAKMANMATASVFYRKTAGSGAPEVQTLATLKTDLGLTGTNSGDQTITLTGDVTGSGTGSFAATIGATKVTSAMLNSDVFSTAHSWGGTQTFTAPVLGTPTSATLTNATGLPTSGLTGTLQAAQEPAHTGDVTNSAGSLALAIGATKVTSAMLNADVFSTAHSWGGIQTLTTPVFTGLPTGTGVATANTVSTLVARDGSGNFSAGTITATLSGNASTVTTNANLTGVITSVGNATSIASQTGTGTKFVVDTSPTVITPVFTTSITINGSAAPQVLLAPSTGATKGTTLYQQGDIFRIGDTGVADRVLIDLATGNTTFTGTVALGANSLTMTGSLGATGARLTKGWFTDLQVTNAIAGSITGNAATVTTNANLTGVITSSGNATSIASQTGTGTKFVVDSSPTIATPSIDTINLTGGQIAFPATQNASAGANTLDDYEEGTWTPVLNSFTVVGATTLSGKYTKVGNLVCWSWSIQAATSLASTTGVSNITGMPFTPAVNTTFGVGDGDAVDVGGGTHFTNNKMFTPTWSAKGGGFYGSGHFFV